MNTFMRPAAAALLTLAMLAACKSKSKNEQTVGGTIDTSSSVVMPDTTSRPVTPPVSAATSDRWSSPNVLGFVVVANDDEIMLGKIAEKRATNAEVKRFGKLMVTDHSAMLADAKRLGKKMSVMADTAADDAQTLASQGRDEAKQLSDKPAGADWDKDYMDKMIADHKAVLEKLQDAAKNTPDAEVRASLEKASAKVQSHLTKAEAIRAKLK